MNNYDIKNIPSPFEVESKKTRNGGWLRYDLNSWGVPWPPPKGWKDELEKAFLAGQTLGIIQECDLCESAVYMAEYTSPCWCGKCIDNIYKMREERKKEVFNIEQKKPYTKKPIPADIRWMVWERDNFTCRMCGSRQHLSIDHIKPESAGGELTLENCQTLCRSCNSKKGARMPNEGDYIIQITR